MLEFIFKQDREFSNPYYDVKYQGMLVGTLRYYPYVWRVHNLGACRLLSPVHFAQIATKLKDLDASLRAQRVQMISKECGEDWLPIADAPKDRRITLWYPKPKHKCFGQWDKEVGDWWIDNYGYSTLHQPTLWRELPEDPK